MNVRELCRLLSATLHLPDVERWAEQLVDRELLPGLDHEVDLKRGLLDLWTEERNTLAKEIMLDIEAQRKQGQEAR